MQLTWKVTPYPSIVDYFFHVGWQWVPPTWKQVVDPSAFRMFAGWITDERKIYKHLSEGRESLLCPWEEDPGSLKNPKLHTHQRYWRITELNNFTCEGSSFVFLYVCTTIRFYTYIHGGSHPVNENFINSIHVKNRLMFKYIVPDDVSFVHRHVTE